MSAIQVQHDNYEEIVAFAKDRVRCRDIVGVVIKFPTEDRWVRFGEWIVRDEDGNLSVISEDPR